MSNENPVQRRIWLAMGKVMTTLFRLNTGKAWISSLGPDGVQRLTDGSVLIKAARPVALGFGLTNGEPVKGACDLPGWTTVKITPEMVGKDIAVFTSIEAKRTTGGKATPDQINWRDQVIKAGGIAGIANSEESAIAIVIDWIEKQKQRELL